MTIKASWIIMQLVNRQRKNLLFLHSGRNLVRAGGYVNSYGSYANSYGAKYGTSNNNNQSCLEKSVQLSRVYSTSNTLLWSIVGKNVQRGNFVNIYIMLFETICEWGSAQLFLPVNEESKSHIDPKCAQHHHKWAAIHCPTNSLLALKNRKYIVLKLPLLINTTYWT